MAAQMPEAAERSAVASGSREKMLAHQLEQGAARSLIFLGS